MLLHISAANCSHLQGAASVEDMYSTLYKLSNIKGNICIYTHTHIYIYICTHTQTHTHISGTNTAIIWEKTVCRTTAQQMKFTPLNYTVVSTVHFMKLSTDAITSRVVVVVAVVTVDFI